MFSYHATWAAQGRRALAPCTELRTRWVRALGRVAGDAFSLFAVVDDHVHVVLYCGQGERGRRVQALSLAFRALGGPPLQDAHVRAVADRGHLTWLVRYVLDQPVHHGLPGHPALGVGSCFADLVGARIVPGLRLRLTDALPRWQIHDAFPAVGLRDRVLKPAGDELVRKLGATRVVAAATFAAAAVPGLPGRREYENAGRLAAVRLGAAVGLSTRELAWAAGLTVQAAGRLKHREPDPALVLATRCRLALEMLCADDGLEGAARAPGKAGGAGPGVGGLR